MSQTKGRVLVVDDDIDTARTLGRILETSGFVVDIFMDPQAALESFKTGCYDLAAIDVRMPDTISATLLIKNQNNEDKVIIKKMDLYMFNIYNQ